MAVPSHGFRAVAVEAAPFLRPWVPIVSLSKGLERDTLLRMTEVAADVLPGRPVGRDDRARTWRRRSWPGSRRRASWRSPTRRSPPSCSAILTQPTLRVYTNPDVVGCEVAGVVKNVIAIAAGMAEGMGFGDNTRATLITRGLAEMTRLGVALGGDPPTFAGLAGMGDLIATCSSKQSRNNSVGLALGQGQTIEAILDVDAHGRRGREELAERARPGAQARRRDADHRAGRRRVSRRPHRRRGAHRR